LHEAYTNEKERSRPPEVSNEISIETGKHPSENQSGWMDEWMNGNRRDENAIQKNSNQIS
jgi:hypothetical protein